MTKTALLLIDIQKGFHDPYWGKRNNPEFEVQAKKLLGVARSKGWKIFHVQHASTEANSPLRPSEPGFPFIKFIDVKESETVVQKKVNGAFMGTDLEVQLRELGIKRVVIAGLTTDHCVSTTTRMASDLGFQTFLVEDATATFEKMDTEGRSIPAEEVQRVNIASLKDEFAKIIKVDEAETL